MTAGARFAESFALGERLGLVDRVAPARGNLARVLLAAGEPAEANAELRRCPKDARALSYPDPLLYGAATLAAIILAQDDDEEAARLMGPSKRPSRRPTPSCRATSGTATRRSWRRCASG